MSRVSSVGGGEGREDLVSYAGEVAYSAELARTLSETDACAARSRAEGAARERYAPLALPRAA